MLTESSSLDQVRQTMPVDWLFCNICIRFNTDKGALPFHVTSCGHVACNTCVEKGRMDPRACGVCKKPTTVKPIDQLKGDVSPSLPAQALLAVNMS